MTPSVASVQRLAFFSLRIPDSELGCDVGSARSDQARELPAYVLSPSPRARCTIEMKFGSQKAGAGQATATAQGASPKTAFCPGASPKSALCARRAPSTWYRAALASLIAKGVVLKAPILVGAIAVDAVLGYAYAARVEDRDARVRMPIGARLEHPLVRVSVHKGCPRR